MRTSITLVLFLLFPAVASSESARVAGDAVDYARHVEPILRARCLKCHGAKKHKAGLRLNSFEAVMKGSQFGPVIISGASQRSPLYQAIAEIGDAEPMPAEGDPLTEHQIAVIKAWIDQGAAPGKEPLHADDSEKPEEATPEHWAFRPLVQPVAPSVRDETWPRTDIDRFILARLENEGLAPSPPAGRRTLIRRLTYDLHGLPPTPAQVQEFLNDNRPDAYERLIDRLLASPRYGERWGRHWLDIVHYGETHGYDKDHRRDNAWPYRDYVIRSLNEDKPYAQFVREQVAGDVLYPDEPDGIIATGFIAAGPWDQVGQLEVREDTVEKLNVRLLDRDDMVSNTIATFMSLTAHCARCHDHKFDPIPQMDYYGLQAVFSGVERGERAYEEKGFARFRAFLQSRSRDLSLQRDGLIEKIDEQAGPRVKELDERSREVNEQIETINQKQEGGTSPSNGYHSKIFEKPDVAQWIQVDLGVEAPIDLIRLIPARPTDFAFTPGFGFPARFRIELADQASFEDTKIVDDHADEDFENPGDEPYVLELPGTRARYVRVTATRLWERTLDYVFALAELQVESGGKNLALGAKVQASSSIEYGRWAMGNLVDGYSSHARLVEPAGLEARMLDLARAGLETKVGGLANEREELVRSKVDPALTEELESTLTQLDQMEKWLHELPEPKKVWSVKPREQRPIHLLRRGSVSNPGPRVTARGLSLLPALDSDFHLDAKEDEGAGRAALAQWITDPRNVLTWRSIANRVWQYHFGRGIVDTPSDFGDNGSRPTHPELLDWLAVRLREGGSIKDLHRLILESAVYRQSSADRPENAERDADNRLLWRMNRRRLEAEAMRDAVMATSGKLNLQMGGPSFELFRYKHDYSPEYHYAPFDGPAYWRRSVYRYIVRSVPDPFLEALDCADPSINTPVRNETLTALQALALMNDPFMLLQARYFAERLRAASDEPQEQIRAAFELAYAREPLEDEVGDLAAYLENHGLENLCRLILNSNEFIFVD